MSNRAVSHESRSAADGKWEHDPLTTRLRSGLPLLGIWGRREFRIRYRQSALGFLWSIVQPAAMLAVFGFVMARVLKVGSEGYPYISFVYVGLVPWTFVATSLSTGFGSLVSATPILGKVYFPREIIPLAVVAASAVDLLIGTGLLVVVLVVQGVGLSVTLVAVIPVYVVLALWVGAVTVLGAVITVFIRDLRLAIGLLLQLMFIASPITYPASLLPESVRWLKTVSPMIVIVEAMRDAALRRQWPAWGSLAAHGLIAAVILLGSIIYTRSVEPRIVDVA